MIERTELEKLLEPVPETMLGTLRDRAVEAMRPGTELRDPIAVDIFQSLDYDWDKFGATAQPNWMRALTFDKVCDEFLAEHPNGTVVSLGDGLDTGFFRTDNGTMRWVSVDVPEVAKLRAVLVPDNPRLVNVAKSAFDTAWTAQVRSPEDGVLILAQGLFQYFTWDDVTTLLQHCGETFPGAEIIFDVVPEWFGRKTRAGWKKSENYEVPAMHFALNPDDLGELSEKVPAITSVRTIRMVPGHGVFGSLTMRTIYGVKKLRNAWPAIARVRF
ncbi:class I SAM-dependent methyltransferase [Hoyosella rhizosphaerae]|uniref:O-methyltransferase OMT n=1 Tax=Hoyosella rhizosphaerae TaxID=1755582 RepID=A0A916UB62_9ACTN|nr:class I SAM-dependent methyltransferase [Hoyosella rhizosphaerae]MBN4925876.1 class I SAM-dependent methyltransferase [Hoyosella rhizosphaerae]GGC67269.1 putative O-methyltransferase OMT [Hoyosella rhizosphaerae]